MKIIKTNSLLMKSRSVAITLVLILCAFLLLIFSPDIGTGIKQGLQISATVLIPTLFPFMALSFLILESDAGKVISKLLSPITKYVFKMPSNTGAVILMSFIGGYPVGARLVSQMYRNKEISYITACRLMYFCVNSGPAFLIGAIGSRMFNNAKIGLILFISQIIGSLFLGMFTRVIKDPSEININVKKESVPFSVSFVRAVTGATSAIFTVCSFVTVFAGLNALLNKLNLINKAAELLLGLSSSLNKDFFVALISGMLEITKGCSTAVHLNLYTAVLLISFLASFAGLCVHFQIKSFLFSSEIKVKGFFTSRLIHGIISVIITSFLLMFLDITVTTSLVTVDHTIFNIQKAVPSQALIPFVITSIIFLLSLTSNKKAANLTANNRFLK